MGIARFRKNLLALKHLAVEIDLEKVRQTKQHGIPRAAVMSK